MPANWTTPTPKIPATALLEHADRLAPGGDLFAHRQKLKGLQRLQRDLPGLEMIFDRVMTGGAEHLPGFFRLTCGFSACWVYLKLRRPSRTAEQVLQEVVTQMEAERRRAAEAQRATGRA